MAQARLGCAFFGSLLIVVILTTIGAVLGLATDALLGHMIAQPQTLSDLLQSSRGLDIGGAIGIACGLFCMVMIIRGAVNVNWLERYGTSIKAAVTSIQEHTRNREVVDYIGADGDRRTHTERETYYVIEASWLDPSTNKERHFKSQELSAYPKNYSTGSMINVLIDPNKPRYLVKP